MHECPSRLVIAQYVTASLSDALRCSVAAHLEHCDRCRHAVADVEKNDTAYRDRLNIKQARLRQLIDENAAGHLPYTVAQRNRRRWVSVFAVAAAASVVLGGLLFALRTSDNSEERFSQLRGGAMTVRVVAKRKGRQFRVGQDTTLQPGDALRFVLTTDGGGYVTVFSLDGAGKLSPFYPQSPARKQPKPYRISRAGRHVLPGSVVLDASPGPERLVVVYAEQSFDRRRVHAALTRYLLNLKGQDKAVAEHNRSEDRDYAWAIPELAPHSVVRVIVANKAHMLEMQ